MTISFDEMTRYLDWLDDALFPIGEKKRVRTMKNTRDLIQMNIWYSHLLRREEEKRLYS